MRYQVRTYLLLAISVWTLSACIHPISKDSRSNLDPDITFAMVSDNPSAFINRNLVVGGVVLSHTAEDGGSTLELMEWKINRWGEPTYLDDSGRRFLVKATEPLDPKLYEPGMLVTLAGIVHGQEDRSLGEQDYSYPVLDLVEIHLWKSPFRYGIHHYDPAHPHYVGSEDDNSDRHPYDPGYSSYPYTPYWYRDSYR